MASAPTLLASNGARHVVLPSGNPTLGTAVDTEANGQPSASTLADYMLPGPTEVPKLRIYHLESPSPHTAYGIKGMGEGGAIAPPAVIFNAVNDAIRATGAEVSVTPLTPRKLLEALDRAKRQAPPKREAA